MMYYGPYSDNLSTFTLLKQIAQIPQNLLLARVNDKIRLVARLIGFLSRTSQVYESHYVYKLQFRFIYS